MERLRRITAEEGKEEYYKKDRKVSNKRLFVLFCIVSEVRQVQERMRRCSKETRVEENIVMPEKGGATGDRTVERTKKRRHTEINEEC